MAVLARAELLLQAKNYSGSGSWLDEVNAHDAVNTGALFLPWTGLQYLHLPALASNNVTSPDAAPLQVTGDIDIRLDIALPDYTTATWRLLTGRWDDALTRSFAFYFTNLNKLEWFWMQDNDVVPSQVVATAAEVAAAFSDGDRVQLRVTLDVDDGASGHTGQLWYRLDGNISSHAGWTALGSPVGASAGTTDIQAGTEELTIGEDTIIGNYYRMQIYSGIAGTLVFDSDFTDVAVVTEPFVTFVERSSSAATVTINRAATGRKAIVVNGPRFLRGTDDMFEVPDDAALDFATGDDFSLMAIIRSYDVTPGSDQVLIAKKTNLTTAIGYALYIDTAGVPNFVLDDGTAAPTTASGPALTDGQKHVITVVRDAAGDNDIIVYTDGVAGTPVTDGSSLTLANAEVLRFGRLSGAGTNYVDDENIANVIWAEALSAADVVIAGNELTETLPDFQLTMGVGV